MDTSKRMSLGFRAKFDQLEKINSEFSRVKIWVCAHGKNRNFSYISKDELDRALPTLAYCPVVAHLFQKEDGSWGIGGHDAALIIGDNGIDLKDLTVPFGAIIADTFRYETVTEYGQDVEYLTAHAYIWTGRYPELEKAIYSDECWFNQSMEILYKNDRPYAEDSNYTEVLDMSFSALCLLQKSDSAEDNVEPCFISSRVEPVKFSLDNEFFKAFGEMKDKLAICLNKNEPEGGNRKLTQEKINEILAEYEFKIEDLDFEIVDDMSEKDFKAKLDDFKKKKVKCSKAEKYAATYRQKHDALENACDPVIVRDENGEVVLSTYYWVQDFSDNFVFVERNVWADDNRESTVGRFAYTFDKATITATLTSEFEQMFVTWLTAAEHKQVEDARGETETVKSDFEKYKSEYTTPDIEVEALKTFQKNALDAQRETGETELFEQFDEKLNTDADYEALKADCKDLSLNEISDRCFSILGKKLANFSMAKPKGNSTRLPVSNLDDGGNTGPYGDVYEKYLK